MKMMFKKEQEQTSLVQMMLFFKNLIGKTVYIIKGSSITYLTITL